MLFPTNQLIKLHHGVEPVNRVKLFIIPYPFCSPELCDRGFEIQYSFQSIVNVVAVERFVSLRCCLQVSKILTNKEFSLSHVKRLVMVSDRDGLLLLYFDY